MPDGGRAMGGTSLGSLVNCGLPSGNYCDPNRGGRQEKNRGCSTEAQTHRPLWPSVANYSTSCRSISLRTVFGQNGRKKAARSTAGDMVVHRPHERYGTPRVEMIRAAQV